MSSLSRQRFALRARARGLPLSPPGSRHKQRSKFGERGLRGEGNRRTRTHEHNEAVATPHPALSPNSSPASWHQPGGERENRRCAPQFILKLGRKTRSTRRLWRACRSARGRLYGSRWPKYHYSLGADGVGMTKASHSRLDSGKQGGACITRARPGSHRGNRCEFVRCLVSVPGCLALQRGHR